MYEDPPHKKRKLKCNRTRARIMNKSGLKEKRKYTWQYLPMLESEPLSEYF